MNLSAYEFLLIPQRLIYPLSEVKIQPGRQRLILSTYEALLICKSVWMHNCTKAMRGVYSIYVCPLYVLYYWSYMGITR